ncbi:MAG: hypothetical protein DRG31_01005 [Deltaproteobacteria bacterium]|nr:MAG: hypothetical protein DRG31_01005 [Deltaproteobacteria bacterium]
MDPRERAKELIRVRSKEGKIACPVALRIAQETGLPSREIGRLLDEMGIKVIECQLGLFHTQKLRT